MLKGEESPNKIVWVFVPSNMTGDRANSNKARWKLPRLSSHRLGVILIVLSFVWGMYLIHVQINDRKSQSEFLKAKIIALSKEYIDAVAKEKGLTADSDVDNGKKTLSELPVLNSGLKFRAFWNNFVKVKYSHNGFCSFVRMLECFNEQVSRFLYPALSDELS